MCLVPLLKWSYPLDRLGHVFFFCFFPTFLHHACNFILFLKPHLSFIRKIYLFLFYKKAHRTLCYRQHCRRTFDRFFFCVCDTQKKKKVAKKKEEEEEQSK